MVNHQGLQVSAVDFPVYADVWADALLVTPDGERPLPIVIVCHGDASSPESICGEAPIEVDRFAQYLASQGFAVLAPRFVPRSNDHADCRRYKGDMRHILHRMSFPVGRHPIGADVDIVRSAADLLATIPKKFDMSRLAIVGSSQGGLTALAAAVLDDRFRAAVVGDYFGDRSRAYEEPADRAVFRHLVEFDDADLASLVAPRPLCIVAGTRDKTMPPAAAGQTAFEAIKTVYVKLNASGALSLMLAGNPKAFPADIGPSAARFLCEQFGLKLRPVEPTAKLDVCPADDATLPRRII